MEASLYLSVVIPAYNEQERLKRFAPGIVEFLLAKGRPFEIVVVNDGSKDDTAAVTRDLSKTYPMLRLIDLHPNRGKGGAVKAGMLDARGQYVLFTDADQSTPIGEADKLLAKIEGDGYDMALARGPCPARRWNNRRCGIGRWRESCSASGRKCSASAASTTRNAGSRR